MKRIGLSQRVDVVASYAERRDCLDQSWSELLLSLNLMPVPLPNINQQFSVTTYLKSMSLDGVILTGGNDLSCTNSSRAAIERDYFERKLIDFSIKNRVPILGVCRGMQMLNIYFGGKLVPVEGHVISSHDVTFTNGEKYAVNSYHDWGISAEVLASELIPLGHSDDGLVEYCKHKTLQITAMMWHPERTNRDSHIAQQIISEIFK